MQKHVVRHSRSLFFVRSGVNLAFRSLQLDGVYYTQKPELKFLKIYSDTFCSVDIFLLWSVNHKESIDAHHVRQVQRI